MEDEKQRVIEYVAMEANEDVIDVTSETLDALGESITAWKVKTEQDGLFWVFADPVMNLYPATEDEGEHTPKFNNADAAFSYHIGICRRLHDKQSREAEAPATA